MVASGSGRVHPRFVDEVDASAHGERGGPGAVTFKEADSFQRSGEHEVADSPPSKNMPRNSSLGHLASLRNMGTGRFVSPSVQSALVILPDYRWWIWWNYLTVFSAMLTGFVEPFKIAFTDTAYSFGDMGFFNMQDYISTAIFLADVMFRFFVANRDGVTGELAIDVRHTSWNYARGMFFWDFCFAFPFDWVISAGVEASGAAAQNPMLLLYISIIKFIKLGRMYRVLNFFADLDRQMVISELALLLIRNWMYVLYSSHTAACVFYLIARIESFGPDSWVGRAWYRLEDASLAVKYIYSLYVSVSSFVGSLGDQDFYEASAAEAAFMIVYCLLNVVLSAYILGTVTMMMVKFDERSKALRDKKTNLIEFKKMHAVPSGLYTAMADHLEMHFHSEQTADENVLQVYPATIRRKVLRQLYMEKVRRCYLFGIACSSKFLDAVLAASRVEVFMPSVELLQVGDIVQELFLVMEGEVQVILTGGGSNSAEHRGGNASGSGKSWGAKSFRAESGNGAMVADAADDDEDEGRHNWLHATGDKVKGWFKKKKSLVVEGRRTSTSSAMTAASFTRAADTVGARRSLRTTSECFGEVAFFTEMPSPEAAITTTVSRILVLSHSAFEALSVTYPMASRMVMQNLVRRQTQLLSDTLDESAFNLTDEERRLILSDAQADAAGVAGGHADAEALEELLDKLPLHQTMQLQTLRNLKQAATQAAEQLGLSRATKLLTSVAANNIQEVKLMLGQGLHPDTASPHDRKTSLMIAAGLGHLAMCQLLLSSGANPLVRDSMNHTALYYAVKAANDDVITLLRQYKASMRGEPMTSAIELCLAIRNGDCVQLRRLLRAGCDPDSLDYESRTALHLAAAEGDLKMVQILVEEGGASVDVRDRHGFLPLDEAKRSKDQAVVEYLEPLMEATPETRASLVHEAQASKWLAAAANGHLSEVNNMLTLQEIDPNLTSYAGGGRTAFMLAAEAGHEDVVMHLLTAGADPSVRDLSGCTALYYASRSGRQELVEELVQRGVTLAMDPTHLTFKLCMAAAQNEDVSFLRCMVKAGANLTAPLMGFGATPLHYAAAADNVAAVQLLLHEVPTAAEDRTPWGTTPLDEAVSGDARRTAALLRRHLGLSSTSKASAPLVSDVVDGLGGESSWTTSPRSTNSGAGGAGTGSPTTLLKAGKGGQDAAGRSGKAGGGGDIAAVRSGASQASFSSGGLVSRLLAHRGSAVASLVVPKRWAPPNKFDLLSPVSPGPDHGNAVLSLPAPAPGPAGLRSPSAEPYSPVRTGGAGQHASAAVVSASAAVPAVSSGAGHQAAGGKDGRAWGLEVTLAPPSPSLLLQGSGRLSDSHRVMPYAAEGAASGATSGVSGVSRATSVASRSMTRRKSNVASEEQVANAARRRRSSWVMMYNGEGGAQPYGGESADPSSSKTLLDSVREASGTESMASQGHAQGQPLTPHRSGASHLSGGQRPGQTAAGAPPSPLSRTQSTHASAQQKQPVQGQAEQAAARPVTAAAALLSVPPLPLASIAAGGADSGGIGRGGSARSLLSRGRQSPPLGQGSAQPQAQGQGQGAEEDAVAAVMLAASELLTARDIVVDSLPSARGAGDATGAAAATPQPSTQPGTSAGAAGGPAAAGAAGAGAGGADGSVRMEVAGSEVAVHDLDSLLHELKNGGRDKGKAGGAAGATGPAGSGNV